MRAATQGTAGKAPWSRAIVIAFVGLTLTLAGVLWLQSKSTDSAAMRFERYSTKVESAITQRFGYATIALKGLRSTFHANDGHMSRLAFRRWVLERNIAADFPGLRGLGFIERVDRQDLARFVARERADHAPQFSVRTSGDASNLYVIKLIEPLSKNEAAWGYDTGSESVRRAAAQRAVDTGEPALTGRIALVQDGMKRPGFLYFLPIYRSNQPTSTAAERREALIGLLYTPIVAEELLANTRSITDDLVDFELLEAPGDAAKDLIFDLDGHLLDPGQDGASSRFQSRQFIKIGGRTLILQTRTTETFDAEVRDLTPIGFGIAGMLLTGLFAAMVWLAGMHQARAEALAQSMTNDLRESKRHAENALRDQQALLETLNRHSLISVTDRSGVILEVNRAFCEISGYTREELIGATHRQINSGHHDPFFWLEMWQTISSGQSWHSEVCNRAKNGAEYWVSSIIAPFFNAEGEIEKYISIRQDITERKRLEHEAKVMAERFTLAIEGGSDGLWDWMDVNTHAEWWSPQFYRLLGHEPGAIPADLITFDRLLHPDDKEPTFQAVNEALHELREFDVEFRLRTSTGEYRWFRSRAKVYFDEFGSASRMAGSIQDIHERRVAQAQLREHIDQMMAIFSLTPDAFISFDAQHQATYASPAFHDLTTMLCDEVKGMDEHVLIARLSRLCREPLNGTTFEELKSRTTNPPRVLMEMQAPNDRVIEISVQQGAGTSVDQVVHFRDVSSELELERMKGEFLSMAAHELRTPMASIYGFTELLLTRELRPEKQRDLLQRIFRQSEVMASIINELLDLARIEARRGKDFKPIAFDLVELTAGVIRDFQPPDQRASPQVTWPAAAIWVRADPQKTQQAVLNVLSNAFKYSPDGGAVQIDFVTHPNREGSPSSATVGLRITDQGIGLSPEQLKRIGERFYRADKSGSIPGTGLGMSIVKEILSLMDGDLHIESELGQGTKITLWLPASPEAA